MQAFEKSLEVYPPGFEILFDALALAHFMRGNDDAVIEWAQRAIEANSPVPSPYALLAMAYSRKGDDERRSRAVEIVKGKFPDAVAPKPPLPGALPTTPMDLWRQTVWKPAWLAAGLPP